MTWAPRARPGVVRARGGPARRTADAQLEALQERLANYQPRQLTKQEREERDYLAQRERLCKLGDACPCDHTRCTDGWWDEERTVYRNGRAYQQVARCPACHRAWLARRAYQAPPADTGRVTTEENRANGLAPGAVSQQSGQTVAAPTDSPGATP